MNKVFQIVSLVIVLYSCKNESKTRDTKPNIKRYSGSGSYDGLHGSWIRHDQNGFTLIEIIDTAKVLYYQFEDRVHQHFEPAENRYWFYKSAATFGYWNDSSNIVKTAPHIWINTEKFRFDYEIKGDTLIEIDKMGVQGKFVKVNVVNP